MRTSSKLLVGLVTAVSFIGCSRSVVHISICDSDDPPVQAVDAGDEEADASEDADSVDASDDRTIENIDSQADAIDSEPAEDGSIDVAEEPQVVICLPGWLHCGSGCISGVSCESCDAGTYHCLSTSTCGDCSACVDLGGQTYPVQCFHRAPGGFNQCTTPGNCRSL